MSIIKLEYLSHKLWNVFALSPSLDALNNNRYFLFLVIVDIAFSIKSSSLYESNILLSFDKVSGWNSGKKILSLYNLVTQESVDSFWDLFSSELGRLGILSSYIILFFNSFDLNLFLFISKLFWFLLSHFLVVGVVGVLFFSFSIIFELFVFLLLFTSNNSFNLLLEIILLSELDLIINLHVFLVPNIFNVSSSNIRIFFINNNSYFFLL